MKVRELREKLLQFDPELDALCYGDCSITVGQVQTL